MTHTVTLEEAISLEFGFPFKSERFNSDGRGVPIVRIRDVVRGTSDTYFDGEFDKRYIVNDGDYLIGMDGEFNLGQWRGGTALLNQRVTRLGTPAAGVDKDYLARFLPAALKQVEDQTPFATVKHLSAKVLRAMPVPLPSLDEQRRIAVILDRADELRAKRRETTRQLAGLSQSIFIDMFGDPIRNPYRYPLVPLGEVGELDRGVSRHRPRNDPALLGGPYPLIQTGEVARSRGLITKYSSTYSELGLAQSKLWPAGTLCITIAANIAETGLLTFDACFPDSVVGFTADKATTSYIRVWLTFLQSTLESAAPQSAQRNINLAILRGLPVPLPDCEERRRFDAAIDMVEQQRRVTQEAENLLAIMFKSIHSHVFSGQL